MIPAPGANKFILIDDLIIRFNYGGTNAWTSNPQIQILYNGVLIQSIAPTWTSTFTKYDPIDGFALMQIAGTDFVNQAVSLGLSAAPTGNAAGDNTITIWCNYTIVDVF